jgi:5'-methylthioadenosine phosphorylase
MGIIRAKIGIIGGSGMYSLLDDAKRVSIMTEYGSPSSDISIGTVEGVSVAFIARHGERHSLPPHKVPYKANIEALSKIGVERIIATTAVGSLVPEYRPGDFVFLDQFVNMTHGRDDTFFHSAPVTHVSSAEPYCSELTRIATDASKGMGIRLHKGATIVVINGPRFSSKAESRFFRNQGFHVIGMTQYPEVMLAREKRMCYFSIGIVTDYDSGLEGDKTVKPVSFEEITRVFSKNVGKVKQLILKTVPMIPDKRGCACEKSLEGAVISV